MADGADGSDAASDPGVSFVKISPGQSEGRDSKCRSVKAIDYYFSFQSLHHAERGARGRTSVCHKQDSGASAGPLKAHLRQAKAHLRQAKAHLRQTEAHLRQTEAHLRQTEAHLRQAKAHLKQTKAHLRQAKAHLMPAEKQKSGRSSLEISKKRGAESDADKSLPYLFCHSWRKP
jgi:hypothetical protein